MVFIKRIKRGNHVYLAEVKSVRDGDKVKHEFIRYVGKEVDHKTILSGSVARSEVTRVSVYGPLLVLHDLASSLGLPKSLGEMSPYILSLVYAHCVEPGSLVSMQKWYERSDLQYLLGLKELGYDKLLAALDSINGREKDIQKSMFESAKEMFDIHPEGVFYDVTNVYFYGSECDMAKRGHNKEGRPLDQVQIGLAVTKDESIPMFHKVFDGNIHDAKTIRHFFDDFETDCRSWIVWDRGITSKENIQDALNQKFHVLCGVPMKGHIKKIVDDIIASNQLVQIENRVALTNTTLYAKQAKYTYEDIHGHLTICVNEKERVAQKERRFKRIIDATEDLKNNRPIPEDIKKYIKYGKINKQAIEEAEKYDAVSLIFSTKHLPPSETLRAYFEKDKVEKAFQCLKKTIEIRPIRHWLTDRVTSHIFICYIAYYLLSALEYKLRPLQMTAPAALDQLKTLYRVHITDPQTKNTFSKTVSLSKDQEKILKSVNKQLIKCSQ